MHFSIHLVDLVPLAKGYAVHDGEIAFNESCLRLGTTKVIMQGGLLAIFFIQPSCRKSFMLVFFPGAVEEEREAVEESKAVEDKVDEGAAFEQVMPSQPTQKSPASSPAQSAMRTSNLESPKRVRSGSCDDHMEVVDVEAMADLKRQSREARVNPARKSRASRRASRRSGMSQKSQATRKTAHTRGSGGTMHTMRSSIGTALTKMTSLSQAGEGLQHACGMEPTIISAKGGLGVARNDAKNDWFDAYGEVEEIDGPKSEAQDSAKAKRGIPKDLRLPACLILSSCLCNTVGCVTIYSRFAIFFKEVHDFNATFAGMAQTAGDITAATVIKVVPFLFSADFDTMEAGCFQRNWHFITSQPYNVSLNLVAWIVLNLCIIIPVLPVAVTAHVLMSSCYVYLQKNNMEMNLFYSLGEQELFLNLQFMAKNFQAAGGLVAGLGAAALYSIDPRVPFLFAAGVALLIFVLWTLGFCARVGYGDNIEMSEAKRAQRRGVRRVSSWATPRKSTARSTRKTTS